MSSWKKVSECSVRYTNSTASKWRSDSGLNLVLIDVEGPIVNVVVALATEAHDDDGLPHTLEHLIFLGSEDYPYKGLLDLYASLCYASGTNAWTSVDHTAYTLKTAGPKGMITMLPIYLDHILYPLLTDYAFTTEIHHITKDGKNAGVVYSEMQGRENAQRRVLKHLEKALFAGTGYDSQTGGALKNLRESTTNDKIKKYHSQFYRPENLSIIITGQVNKEDIFKALQPIEDKILKKNKESPPVPFVRPWQQQIPPLKETKILRYKYPTDSEDCGVIMIGWRGPKVTDYHSFYEFLGCGVLLSYFSNTAVAPFQKALVEIENPFASDISILNSVYSTSMLTVVLNNVPLARLDQALPELQKVIYSAACSNNALDLKRLHDVLQKEFQGSISQTENSPHEVFPYIYILDMLYSIDDNQFDWRLNMLEIIVKLLEETCEWWENLFKKYFLQHSIAIIGEPSSAFMKEISDKDTERFAEQKRVVEKEGISMREKELNDAINYNERKPPPDILSLIDIKDCGELNKFTIDEWYTGGPECPHFNVNELPFYSRIQNVHTKFVYINLLLNTCALTKSERMFLPLLIENLTQSTFYRNESKLDYNVLVKDIERLTISLDMNVGFQSAGRFNAGNFHNSLLIEAECEPNRYNEVVDLLWHILTKTIFERKRVQIVAQKMINEVSQIRRNPITMMSSLIRDLITKKDTNVNAVSIIRQQRFLTEALSKLEKDDEESVNFINKLDCVRQKLINTNDISLHFAADLKLFKYSAEPWAVFRSNKTECQSVGDTRNCQAFTSDHEMLVDLEERQELSCVVGMGSVDSYYVDMFCRGPETFSHPDVPAFIVAANYFTQSEGEVWRMIRGAGLAYGCYITPNFSEGLIHFKLSRASNPSQAYETTKNIIETFIQTETWDDKLFKSAKCNIVFELISMESSPSKLIKESLKRYLRGLDSDFTLKLAKAVSSVTKADVIAATKRWMTGLFDPKLKSTVIICNTSEVNKIRETFEKMDNQSIKVFKSLEESHLATNYD